MYQFPPFRLRRRNTCVHNVATCLLLVLCAALAAVFVAESISPGVTGVRGYAMAGIPEVMPGAPPTPCQLLPTPSTEGAAKLREWAAPACQSFFQCASHEPFLINRTCTIEDEQAEAPMPRGVALVVAQDFRVAYVANPSAVDHLMQFILRQFLGGEDLNSHHLSMQQLSSYFFFSFIDSPRDRFLLQFTRDSLAAGALNRSSGCPAVRAEAAAAAARGTVPTQAFVLSGDAGVMDHMLQLDWLGDARDVGNVLALLRHVQHLVWPHRCVPEINFLQVNFDFQQRDRQIYDTVKAFGACLDAPLTGAVDAYYRQDLACWLA